MIRKELGRSMVEILGVLAIIGILSAVALTGYRMALNKQQANDIINEVNIRAYEFSRQLMMGFDALDESEFASTTKQGFPITGAIFEKTHGYFDVLVSEVPAGVCREIIKMNWRTPIEIFVNDEKASAENVAVCEAAPADIDFVFAGDLAESPDTVCKNDRDCAPCESCIENLCANPNGYILVGGQCLIGNPCFDGANWDEEKQKCVCENDYVYTNGKCEPFVHCGTGASWDAQSEACICDDTSLIYNERLKACEENTCQNGKYLTYYRKDSIYYAICCEEGETGAYVDENNQIHANGYCCPKEYTVGIPDAAKYGWQHSYCMSNVCQMRDAVTFFVSGIDVPICCDEGILGGGTAIVGQQASYPGGVCCPRGYSQMKGFRQSYCVYDSCPSDKPNTLTFKKPSCGGDGAPHTDTVPICCPDSSKYAAVYDEKGAGWGGGYCCPEGYGVVNVNCGQRCVLESCPSGEHMLTFKHNYGSVNVCCPDNVQAAARCSSDGKKCNAQGVCCEPGETAMQSSYSVCNPTVCEAGKHLVPYVHDSASGQTCCPENTKGARIGLGGFPICCGAGEIAIGNFFSKCAPESCPEGEELSYFSSDSLSSEKGQPNQKCCPIGRKAARCDSSGTCVAAGVCCEAGESVVEKDYASWCIPATCPTSAPNRLQFKYAGKWVDRCCPATSKAAAVYNAQNVQFVGGVCCGENEIAITSGSNTKCQACAAGLIPNESGDECV